MKKILLAAALAAGAVAVHAEDTLKKVKDSGVITMGVRESSGLAYTIGDGKYVGYHIDVCHRVIADLEKQLGRKLETKYQPVTSANRIPLTVNGTERQFVLVNDVKAKPVDANKSVLAELRKVLSEGQATVSVSGYVDGWVGRWPDVLRQPPAKRPQLMVTGFTNVGK